MKTLFILFCIGTLSACDTSYTLEIKQVDHKYLALQRILENPSKYADKEVLVKGISSETTKTPFASMYQLSDATGSIWVQTSAPIPKENSRIYLKAKVETLFSFKDNSLGLHLVEIGRERQ